MSEWWVRSLCARKSSLSHNVGLAVFIAGIGVNVKNCSKWSASIIWWVLEFLVSTELAFNLSCFFPRFSSGLVSRHVRPPRRKPRSAAALRSSIAVVLSGVIPRTRIGYTVRGVVVQDHARKFNCIVDHPAKHLRSQETLIVALLPTY